MKTAALSILSYLIVLSATAQKLPAIQKVSVFAPANIKIDGKATEWDNKFQAYNKSTDLYYIVSNNNETLFLTVQSSYMDVVHKIITGGITFTINQSNNKTDKDAISITYPFLRDEDQISVFTIFQRHKNMQDAAKNEVINIDELNKILQAKSKTIELIGIKGITDKYISVYNQNNIKTADRFDGNMAYTYELAIPLKYLGLSNDKFIYQVKINQPVEPKILSNGKPAAAAMDDPLEPMPKSAFLTTDFWGEYTLAKK